MSLKFRREYLRELEGMSPRGHEAAQRARVRLGGSRDAVPISWRSIEAVPSVDGSMFRLSQREPGNAAVEGNPDVNLRLHDLEAVLVWSGEGNAASR